ncbi:UDP-2,3-diacylglucosamine diphosphatase [Bacteroidota bacterium]
MQEIIKVDQLPIGEKIYFAADFHLGAPTQKSSLTREKKIVRWLEKISSNAHIIFILGDIFDFWFEYKHVIPKGFTRLKGKLMELKDAGKEIVFFSGNHDMWMFDYFQSEFGIPVYRDPQKIIIGNKLFLIGHGDGLGKGDWKYKILKKTFEIRFTQWAFSRLHPNFGIWFAQKLSDKSRVNNYKHDEEFKGEDEWLLNFCRQRDKIEHFDYFIFGHRHMTLDLEVSPNSRYINVGEWIEDCSYAEFDGNDLHLKYFEKSS